jgi:alpha-L-rhamnosidase
MNAWRTFVAWVGAVVLNRPVQRCAQIVRAVGDNRPYLAALLLLVAPLEAAMRPVSLKCEHAAEPLGVDVPQPALFWQVADDRVGARQTAYQILVASTPELLAADRGDLWDSDRVASDATTFIAYAGSPLRDSQRVHWKVRVWDADGAASEWSAPATWTMGLPSPAWRGKWIMAPGERLENTLARTEFSVKPGLRRAIVHVSGLGHYELFFNGRKAGDDVLAPGWTDYRDTVLYDTRDVTALLREGRNAVGFSLGNGMLHVERITGKRFAKFTISTGPQRAILHLRLDYADGTTEIVGTDETWKTAAGPITFSSMYGGEDYDARREPRGWKEAGFDATTWTTAVPAPSDLGVLRGFTHAAEPVMPIETRAPVSVRDLAPGVQLVDFGQNVSFMPRIRVSGPAGSTVRLTGGEVVKEDGTINRDTLGGAHRGSAWWSYTKATDGEETWFPQFYYLGSRYLYVELLSAHERFARDGTRETIAGVASGPRARLEQVEMVIVHSAAKRVGHFAASDPRLGRIRDLIVWAQRSNMVSILTDCPHREKLGWLEQLHLNGHALRYEWDLARLMTKAMGDMADAQLPDGLVPNVAPEYVQFEGSFRNTAEWGASFIIVPWQQYLFTGDTRLMRARYEAMKRYFAFLEKEAGGGVLKSGLGDWYDVLLGAGKRANLTPGTITATAHYYLDAAVLAETARVLGQPDEAEEFRRKAGAIGQAFRREFRKMDTKELYGSGSDTSLALALALGLVASEDRATVFTALVKTIEERGYSTSGAIGYRYLLQALTAGGRPDVILKTALNENVPGYAFQLKQGATALPESWSALLGASHNHFFLGQILEWFHQHLVGLAPDPRVPGFKRMMVRPELVDGITWAESSHESLHGRHAVRWERDGANFTLKITVPANTSARVLMPGRDASCVQGAKAEGQISEGGVRTIFEVPAGSYEFRSTL